jgi:hypothetical protein
MTRPLTLRLEEPDYDRLQAEAADLGMKPGTLARVLLHASLGRAPVPGRGRSRRDAAVLDRLAALTAELPGVDAVRAAAEARLELDGRGAGPA